MITVRDLLRIKGSEVFTTSPRITALEALRIMAEKNVGALIVMDEGSVVGIISERDFARSLAKTGDCNLETPVEKYMTREVYAVRPAETIQACMELMTRQHFRHLPVIDQGALLGVISIGDVVKQIVSSQEGTIQQLEDYILGRGYGTT